MSEESPDQLIKSLASTADELERLLRDLPNDALRRPPSSDEFSALENVCHLRDIEIDGYTTRIDRILNEECPALPDIDGARLACEREYNNQDLAEALDAFAQARKRNVAVLSEISEAQLARSGFLAGVGEVTLGKLLSMMHEHDEGHLADLKRILRVAGPPAQEF
jgi:hypothetical protein